MTREQFQLLDDKIMTLYTKYITPLNEVVDETSEELDDLINQGKCEELDLVIDELGSIFGYYGYKKGWYSDEDYEELSAIFDYLLTNRGKRKSQDNFATERLGELVEKLHMYTSHMSY